MEKINLLVIASIFVAMFLVTLDRLIISTAIPQITNEFHSTGDIGWYGTAYLLTSCSVQLVFGKIYTLFSVKTTLLATILLFEAGSALCAAAPSSLVFIIGRALAGLGAGGVLSGVMVVVVYTIPLNKRPQYQGFFGAVVGISSVTGPLIGGAFTSNITWRWCFYLNLPLGGLVFVLILFLLHLPDRPETKISLREKLVQLNVWGLLVLLPGVVCLCLALQWSSVGFYYLLSTLAIHTLTTQYRRIILSVFATLLILAFISIQIWRPDQAIVPPRVFLQRSIVSGVWVSACLGHMMLIVYFLPLWFQGIQSLSAVQSGIHLLPTLVPMVAASIVTGHLVSRIGYYTPFLIGGTCLASIGTGLFTTLDVQSTLSQWVGYQILYGFGLGMSSQAPNMAAQTVLQRTEAAMGISLMFFAQLLFGSVFLSIGETVLQDQLVTRLGEIAGLHMDITLQQVENMGATELMQMIPDAYRQEALVAYNDSLGACFQIALILACLSVGGGIFMEWRSVRERGKEEKEENKKEEKEKEEKEKEEGKENKTVC
ncbi:hypothetical protein ASPZODRAFT_167617 [Penicilliopsis zonata CBS 506.65]|uniref:Major facilitator superfamily (MFS) profile domain-containing protein n=1 Tax=Penicilliopsis zonata CBS 506.65 TaxID=1073090 RepID=A0A1L9SF64_9EURO|nr:hypothetical protein ASPZODRAFT_167617 [Penicilliopsis zonata CBS 506.65]OJJ45915.1 hypothetical protein ASPZODRAFT_167617 [Penicilliopsis zonata CBS 506.65]